MQSMPRFFYNHDGSFLSNYRALPQLSVDEFVYESVGRLIGTQVDGLAFNMFNFGDAVPLFPTEVPEAERVYLEEFSGAGEWREQTMLQWSIENDPWPDVVQATHDAAIRFWVSMRFNDVHPRGWISRFRANHPEYELGDQCPSALHTPDSAFMGVRCKGFNFAIPEVRAFRLALLEEACSRYDVDGFEWDFTRHHGHFFPDVEKGRRTLNDYLREAREALDRIGKDRGRPIGFGVVVSATPEICHDEGMDVATWIRDGIVDYVTPSAGGPSVTNPFFAPFLDMARGTECLIYGCTSEMLDGRWAPNWGPPPAGTLRAGALNAWREGVDGIYLYNFNVQVQANRRDDFILLGQLGNAATLEFADKTYMLTSCHNKPHLEIYEYQLPLELDPRPSGPGKSVHFFVGDDLARARKLKLLESLFLAVRTSAPCDEEVEFLLNGRRLPRAPRLRCVRSADKWWPDVELVYDVTREGWVRSGRNELEAALRRRDPRIRSKFAVREVALEVRYRSMPVETSA